MIIRLASNIETDSIVNGVGLRTVIWTQGCKHNCEGCHNPQTHDFLGGFEVETEDVIKILSTLKLQKGITFSGGEPFEQASACFEIANAAHKMNFDVWSYTGYKFEDILKANRADWNKFIREIDVIVDGKFLINEKDLSLQFRGSKNQRIINVKDSLINNDIFYYKYS